MSNTDLVVQKFGGTSLATPEMIKRVATRVVQTREEGKRVLVVVSAMGDTTDRLADLARAITRSPSRRELDMLLTAGERISMALLSMALNDLGHHAISFTGSQSGIVTDASHTQARILQIRALRIEEELERDKIVIVAGFQGVSETKEVTTLGRGGSDTSAVALASALGASACEIYSDVDGLYTADPRMVPEARLVPVCSHAELVGLASLGSRLLHVRSARLAGETALPLTLKGTFSSSPGTRVVAEAPAAACFCSLAACEAVGVFSLEGEEASRKGAKIVRALEDERGAWSLLLPPDPAGGAPPFLILDAGELDSGRSWLEDKVGALSLRAEEIGGLAGISLVGAGCGLREELGNAVDGILRDEGIRCGIRGRSPEALTLLVDRPAVQDGLRALHRRLGELGLLGRNAAAQNDAHDRTHGAPNRRR